MSDRIGSRIRLGPADYRRTPWKNGGGVTVDIAGVFAPSAEPGGWSGMIWRFGRTRIESPGPFSDLSGHDRILAVIEGRGLVLHSADAETIDVSEPFRPVRFPGERRIVSALEEGGVGVLNLMGDRRRVAIDLVFLTEPTATEAGPGTVLFYAPGGGASFSIAGRVETVEHDHALRIEVDVPVPIELGRGLLAVASIEQAPVELPRQGPHPPHLVR